MFESYYDSFKFLESLSNFPQPDYMISKGCDFYLKRTEELIKKLKINLDNFKIIHITGTSGKGSVVSMVHQILFESGERVGSFCSPHPTTAIERIKVDDKFISPSDFTRILNEIKPAMEEIYMEGKWGCPSFFEVFFALSLVYFKEQKCNYIVLEVGCGGEFDATNIIKNPTITAITNIGFDHMKLLGNTLRKITITKSKIIKNNSVFITTEVNYKLLKIFEKECEEKKSIFKAIDCSEYSRIKRNQLLATKICNYLKIKEKYIEKGIKNNFLSCRFETIQNNPRVILDGAHNPDKIRLTVDNLKSLEFNNLFLVITLNKGKETKKIIKILSSFINEIKTKDPEKSVNVFITRHLVEGRVCEDFKLMLNLFKKSNNNKFFIDPHKALDESLKKAKNNDLVLITGSFYLAGELRKRWIKEEKILKKRKQEKKWKNNKISTKSKIINLKHKI